MRPQPMPTTCDFVAPLLPGFVGEELAEKELTLVGEHLRDCCSCRRDAASYMQANKALRRAAESALLENEIDFDAMQATIMQRVSEHDVLAADAQSGGGWANPWPNRLMVVAAAVLLCSFGFWLGAEVEPESIWVRPASVAVGDRGYVVLPYAGSPADIRPVGQYKYGDLLDGDGIGSGMAGRGQLRTDVEGLTPPVLYR